MLIWLKRAGFYDSNLGNNSQYPWYVKQIVVA